MKNRQAARASYITELLAGMPTPRNQVASISGLTNTYIRDLEQGNIVNVPRDKLIALAMAINLRLDETNQLLNLFDRASLSAEDVACFADAFDKMKLTSAVYPICDHFAYELACGAVEQHPGRQIIVNDRPTNSLKEPGHRSYSESYIDEHPIFFELTEAIGRKRRKILEATLADHVVEHIVFRDSLDNYILNCSDAKERYWRGLHVANMREMVRSCPHFRLYLVETASCLLFTIKYPDGEESENPMLIYCAVGTHDCYIQQSRRLSGFATSSPVLVRSFEREAEDIKRYVNENALEPAKLETYLTELIAKSR